jgi:hypothetical protein
MLRSFVHALFIHSSIQLFQTYIIKGIILCGRETSAKYAACPLIKLINTIVNICSIHLTVMLSRKNYK